MGTTLAAGHETGRVALRRLSQILRHSVAPGLVLLAPFLAFLKFQGYGYHPPEVLLCLAVITGISLVLGAVAASRISAVVVVLAGVLTLFVDFQISNDFRFHGISKEVVLAGGFILLVGLLWLIRRHAERAITLMAATVLISTVLMPKSAPPAAGATSVSGGRSDLPLIVHVILDEHIGIDGLEPARSVPGLQADLRSFYQSLGFRTFDAAYSEYKNTERSISHLLNFSPGEYHPDTVRQDTPGFSYGLTRNAYLSRMMERGYLLRVYQSDFLQLCPETGSVACATYTATGIAVLPGLPLGLSERARLIAGAYLRRSKLNDKATDWYDVLRRQVAKAGVHLPRWAWFRRTTAPLNGLREMRQVAHDLSGATRGELYFAHLMLPHSPHVYGNDCGLLPFDRWTGIGYSLGSELARTGAYAGYDLQVRCASRMIQEIIDAIPSSLRADAILVVQGDHGSRLSLANRELPGAKGMTADDYRDSYSTLFAVRAPGLAAGSDRRFVPITCILRSLVVGGFRGLPGLDNCVPAPAVFVTDLNGAVVKTPLAPFAQRP